MKNSKCGVIRSISLIKKQGHIVDGDHVDFVLAEGERTLLGLERESI